MDARVVILRVGKENIVRCIGVMAFRYPHTLRNPGGTLRRAAMCTDTLPAQLVRATGVSEAVKTKAQFLNLVIGGSLARTLV